MVYISAVPTVRAEDARGSRRVTVVKRSINSWLIIIVRALKTRVKALGELSCPSRAHIRRSKILQTSWPFPKTHHFWFLWIPLHDSGGCQCSTTAIYAVDIWDRQDPRSGTTVHSEYATTTMMMMDDLCQKWKVKLIFQGTYRLSGTGIVEYLKIIDIGCDLKQFDVEADRRCIFHFRP